MSETAANTTESELRAKRADLFRLGSEFKPTRREHIVGIDNILCEIEDVVHWLKHAREYQKHNSRLEPGIIFEGQPGTGKTLVSRWIATESGAAFISVRDFPIKGQLFTAKDISALFKHARETYASTKRPVVLFWDEFENSAITRDDCTPEQAEAVAQLTAELDGVHGKNEGILLIGCTNYMHSIDRALKRPGRMGLHIQFTAPDREGKKKLLEFYLRDYQVQGKVEVDDLSYFFQSRACAADIEEACVEAWRYAVRRVIKEVEGDFSLPQHLRIPDEPYLSQADLVEVFVKRLVGPPSAFISMPDEDRMRIAIHEVGHAVAAIAFGIPFRLITVQPGKNRLGCVITAEPREHVGSMDEYEGHMRVSFGSIAAEQVAGVPASVGATGDLAMATSMASYLVDNLYAGKRLGLLVYRTIGSCRNEHGLSIGRAVSERTIEDGDMDVRDLLAKTHEEAIEVMEAVGKDNLWKLARVVTDTVTMTGEEFRNAVDEIVGITAMETEVVRV